MNFQPLRMFMVQLWAFISNMLLVVGLKGEWTVRLHIPAYTVHPKPFRVNQKPGQMCRQNMVLGFIPIL